MPEQIHVRDLAHPVYNEAQRAALASGDTLEVSFRRDAILAAARERTGLEDFGPDDFLERLDLLVDEWGSDDELTGLGRFNLFQKLVQHAVNRLLIQNAWSQNPEILEIEIATPIIVAGLPRSGTTHLLNLMAADSRLRSLPLWESYEPVPLPSETTLPDGTDPRYRRSADTWSRIQQTTPLLAAMHPMNPDHIHEELELMGGDFASYNYEWLCPSPRWRDHYLSHDQTPHYEYMKNVLRLLLWQQRGTNRPTRWVLKCPQHLEQLPVLTRVFPDATVVITHRDPVAVIQSAVTMLAYGQRMSRRRIDCAALVAYWSDRVERLLRACVADRSAVSEAQSIDVPFHEFMADDLAMVRRIYERADLPVTSDAEHELRAFVTEHPRGKHGQVIYDLERDFGVRPDELRERFAFYFDAFRRGQVSTINDEGR